MDTGWLDIRLNALLPHCKTIGGTEYITDTITRLLDRFHSAGGEIPTFDKAFVAIVEHSPMDTSGAYDHDNKGFKAVINAHSKRQAVLRTTISLKCLWDCSPCRTKTPAATSM